VPQSVPASPIEPPDTVAARKAMCRAQLVAARTGLGADYQYEAARAARDRVLDALAPAPGAIVAGYVPIRGEMDPMPLLEALAARGHALALPVTPPPDADPILVFRLWNGNPVTLEPGPFRTRQPPASAPTVVPDWLLVPLVGFDRSGARLGYGAGYYDRALAGSRTTAVGLAFACQEVTGETAPLPVEPHDIPLSAIATEREVIRPGPVKGP